MKTYTVTATGDTFRVKQDLKEWAFAWISDEKAWVKNGFDDDYRGEDLGPQGVTRHKDKIERAAKRFGWRLEQEQKNIGLLIFVKTLPGFDDAQINVYTTKMTVTTILWHPKRGRGSMYRLNVPFHMLKAIFENPRVHSSKFNHAGGYFPRKASTQMPRSFYGI